MHVPVMPLAMSIFALDRIVGLLFFFQWIIEFNVMKILRLLRIDAMPKYYKADVQSGLSIFI